MKTQLLLPHMCKALLNSLHGTARWKRLLEQSIKLESTNVSATKVRVLGLFR